MAKNYPGFQYHKELFDIFKNRVIAQVGIWNDAWGNIAYGENGFKLVEETVGGKKITTVEGRSPAGHALAALARSYEESVGLWEDLCRHRSGALPARGPDWRNILMNTTDLNPYDQVVDSRRYDDQKKLLATFLQSFGASRTRFVLVPSQADPLESGGFRSKMRIRVEEVWLDYPAGTYQKYTLKKVRELLETLMDNVGNAIAAGAGVAEERRRFSDLADLLRGQYLGLVNEQGKVSDPPLLVVTLDVS